MPASSLLPAVRGAEKAERHVMLQSYREPPPADAPLAGFEAVHGRVGCSALPDVKLFSDLHLYGQEVEPTALPVLYRTAGSKQQRLKKAPACERRRPMGVPTDDPTTRRLKNERTRTEQDMIGTSVEREALRVTPLDREKHVVRPGFREKGLAQQAHLRQLREQDERQHLQYRAALADATRRRMRQTRETHAQSTRVQLSYATMMQQTLVDEQQSARALREAYRRSVAEAAEAAELAEARQSLSRFERARQASRAAKRKGGGNRARVIDEEDEL